jgi:hypothetical protein
MSADALMSKNGAMPRRNALCPSWKKSRVGAFDLARGALIGCYFNS